MAESDLIYNMLSSNASPKLSPPASVRPLPPAGQLLQGFLEALQEVKGPSSVRKEALRGLFRWYLRLEGLEEARLSGEELALWRGRFYGLLPPSLKGDFPWEVPPTLPPPPEPKVSYPRQHAPLREYGFIATRAVDLVATMEPAQQSAVLPALVRAMVSLARYHGYEITSAVAAEHVASLSGGALQVGAGVIAELTQREAIQETRHEPPRARGKPKRRPFWRRK